MDVKGLVANYSYGVDVSSVVFCTVLLILIKFVLYFSTDRKFSLLKRSVWLVLVASIANILFGTICEHFPEKEYWLFLLRDIYHGCLMSCLLIFILYLRHMLGVNGRFVNSIRHLTRLVTFICFTMDMASDFTHIGFYKDSTGWHDSIVSFYNIYYIYGMLILLCMLVFYNNRLIHSVKMCLGATDIIVVAIMIKAGLSNSNTFTTLTYILPIFVVMILLHSKPFDVETGAMSSNSFDSYIERYVKSKQSMDFLVLYLKLDFTNKVPVEVGKALSNFWNSYFAEASLFSIENGVYVLSVPRVKKNGNTEDKCNELFHDVFPKQYAKFRVPYKIIGLTDMDFIQSSSDIKNIINYLLLITEDNSVLIADKKLKQELKIMRSVKENLEDIEKKGDLNDSRVIVYCQPVRNTKTGIYDTAEALMRLSIKEQDIVPPNLFIPLAESYGHIHSLTKIIFNKTCEQLKILENEGYSFNRVSINVAMSELRDDSFCSEVIDIIRANNIDPSKIGIELTESQNETDFFIVRDKISTLKEAGITIYLDDFGTGYSNLERILQLGLDVIKYDRSILLAAEKNENVAYMLRQFAGAFKQFEYQLLFEGIETGNQEKICVDCGADYLQGFKFSKPVPIEQLRNYFEKRSIRE